MPFSLFNKEQATVLCSYLPLQECPFNALRVVFYLRPLFYKAFLSMIGGSSVIKKEK